MPILRKCTLKYLSMKGYDVYNLPSYGSNTHIHTHGGERGIERKRGRGREGVSIRTIKQMM